jgi:hypothetical protein
LGLLRLKKEGRASGDMGEIRKRYAGQWVLIEYRELDDQLNVIDGEVITHSPDKETIYKHLLKTKGEIPTCAGATVAMTRV